MEDIKKDSVFDNKLKDELITEKKNKYNNKVRRIQRGDMMKVIRLKMGYKSQGEFADFLGVSRRMYNQFERGKVDTTLKTLDYWLDKCGVGIVGITI